MERALTISVYLGSIFLAAAGFFSSQKQFTFSIWTFFFALVTGAFFICGKLQQAQWETSQSIRTKPMVPMELPSDCKEVEIQFGEKAPKFPIDPAVDRLLDGWGAYLRPRIFQKRFYLDATCFSGGTIAEFRQGAPVKLPPGWDWNCDSNAAEIVDQNSLTVFQVLYVGPSSVKVMGIFYGSDNNMKSNIVAGHKYLLQQGLPSTTSTLDYKFDRLFLYPSIDHPGERVNPE